MNLRETAGNFLVGILFVSICLAISGPSVAQSAKNLNCKGCVNSRDIEKGAVNSGKIKNRSISPQDLSNAAKPGGADYTEPTTFISLANSEVVVGEVTLKIPGPGIVIANASAWAFFGDNPSGVLCGISRTQSIDDQTIIAQNHNETNANRMPIAATLGFKETKAGIKKYRFICRTQLGSINLYSAVLTAIFTPNRY